MENSATSSASNGFESASGIEADRTYYFEEVCLVPAAVVRAFGQGDAGDEYKVSQRWVFRNGELVFTLYDWKSTSLYDPGMWTPEELWSSKEPFPLHVGSKEPATPKDAARFVRYLQEVTSEHLQSKCEG